MRRLLLPALAFSLSLSACPDPGTDAATAEGKADAEAHPMGKAKAAPGEVFFKRPNYATPTHLAKAPEGARRVEIEVGASAYAPNKLEAAAGEQLILAFKRTDDNECNRFLTFFNSAEQYDLPLNETFEVAIQMPEEGEIVFACGMNMYHGLIAVVQPAGEAAPAEGADPAE